MEGDRGRIPETQILAIQLADSEFDRNLCGGLVFDVSKPFGLVVADRTLGDSRRGIAHPGLHHLS